MNSKGHGSPLFLLSFLHKSQIPEFPFSFFSPSPLVAKLDEMLSSRPKRASVEVDTARAG